MTGFGNCQLSIIHCQLILACHRFPARFYPGARLTAVGLSAVSFLPVTPSAVEGPFSAKKDAASIPNASCSRFKV